MLKPEESGNKYESINILLYCFLQYTLSEGRGRNCYSAHRGMLEENSKVRWHYSSSTIYQRDIIASRRACNKRSYFSFGIRKGGRYGKFRFWRIWRKVDSIPTGKFREASTLGQIVIVRERENAGGIPQLYTRGDIHRCCQLMQLRVELPLQPPSSCLFLTSPPYVPNGWKGGRWGV